MANALVQVGFLRLVEARLERRQGRRSTRSLLSVKVKVDFALDSDERSALFIRGDFGLLGKPRVSLVRVLVRSHLVDRAPYPSDRRGLARAVASALAGSSGHGCFG